mgnify:CR=1 FL=1
MGFSLYSRLTDTYAMHGSIVENTLFKASGTSWLEWLADMRDRRDISKYLH